MRAVGAAVLGLLLALSLLEVVLRVGTRGGTFAGLPLLPLDVAAPLRSIAPATLGHAYLTFDRELGWTVGPSRRSADGLYASTPFGARDDGGAPGVPEGGPVWALAFGDSFTHGDDVPGDATWEHALRARTGRTIVNFGVPAYGADQALLRYRALSPRWSAPTVFIGFMADNIARHLNRYRPFLWPGDRIFFVKPRFERQGDRLALVPSPFHDVEEYFASDVAARLLTVGTHDAWYRRSWYEATPWDHCRTARVVRTALALRTARGPRWRDLYADASAVALTRRILLDFAAAVHERGGAPVVLFFPDQTMCADALAGRPALAGPLLDSLARSGVEVVDLTSVVAEVVGRRPPLEAHFRPHYSPELNATVAAALAARSATPSPASRP